MTYMSNTQVRALQEAQRHSRQVTSQELYRDVVGGAATSTRQVHYEQQADGKYYPVRAEMAVDSSMVEGSKEASILKLIMLRSAALAASPSEPPNHALANSIGAEVNRLQAEIFGENRERSHEMFVDDPVEDPRDMDPDQRFLAVL